MVTTEGPCSLEQEEVNVTWIKHLTLWFMVTFISLLTLFAIAFIPPPLAVQPIITEGVEQLMEIADAIDSMVTDNDIVDTSHHKRAWCMLSITTTIYVNNARLNAFFSTPFIGGIIYGSSLAVNGWIGRYVAERIAGDKWYILLACTLFASPHSYLEFLAYSIAVTESAILSLHIIKRRVERRHLKQYAIYIALSFIILLVAAVSEASIILLLNG